MEREELTLVRDLLRGERLLALAVVVDGGPAAGLVPFLASPDFGALVVHVSGLARHSKGLGDGLPWSGVIHVPDAPSIDPLQVPRITLHGTSRRVEDEPVLAAIRAQWVERYPTARMTVGLGDFTFVSLDIDGGRLVAGLGLARNLGVEHLAQASAI